MNHLFVPYEIAKQLKDKGFNEVCLSLITPNGSLETTDLEEWEKLKGTIDVPLYQQVVDWFNKRGCVIRPDEDANGYEIRLKSWKYGEYNHHPTIEKAFEKAFELI